MFSFVLICTSVPCTGPGQLYKGVSWCLCFPFAQTDVRITLPSITRGWHENATCYLQANSVISGRQELCLAVVDQDSFAVRYPWLWLVQGRAAQHPAVSSSSSQRQRVHTGCSQPCPSPLHDSCWCPGCMRTGEQSKVPGCLFVSPVKVVFKGIVL